MRSLLFLLLLFMPMIINAQDKKITVALLDFEISGNTRKSISPVMTGLMRKELLRSERYEVQEQGIMEAILR